MKHLILVGACYLDTILSVPHYPGEDAKLRATSLEVRRGGNCPNALEVLQQLLADDDAVRMYLASNLPAEESAATRRVKASFGQRSSVDFRHCLFREGHAEAASCYVLRSEQTGSRTLVSHNDLPDMTVAEFERMARSFNTDQETWWHFEGIIPETTLEFVRLVRKLLPHAQISVEVENPQRKGLSKLAAEADVAFYSRTWAETNGYDSAEACLRNEERPRAFLSLCTWGADGAAGLSRSPSGESLFRCPVRDEVKGLPVIDSIGAGDTFVAGILYGLLAHAEDWDARQKVSFAVDLATLKVQREGFGRLGADALGGQHSSGNQS